ncbi:uncharacterized protein FTOL_13967 [Fusarium torulosum]|jgi:hypothetical protein
MLPS